jgi:hypothetical protein
MKKILDHNCSLLRNAYGEGSLICHGLIGLYIPRVVVVSHPSGSRKLLWWRQRGPVMSSWSNGLLAGLLKWRQCGPEVSELTNRRRAPQMVMPDVSPGYGLGESRWLILLRTVQSLIIVHADDSAKSTPKPQYGFRYHNQLPLPVGIGVVLFFRWVRQCRGPGCLEV